MALSPLRSAAAGLALLMGVGSVSAHAAPAASAAAPSMAAAAQSVSDANLTDVRYRRYHHRRGYRNGAIGAGLALGTLGLIAGATAYNRGGYYRCDPYYDDCYPRRRAYYRYYDEPRYYYPPPRRGYYYGY